MMRIRLMLIAGALLMSACACAETIVEDFEGGDISRWQPLSGDWIADDGAFIQLDASAPEYRMALFDRPWRGGSCEIVATPLERNANGNVGTSFGIVVKHLSEDRWCAARVGSYGKCSLIVRDGERKQTISLGHFAPVPGRTYTMRVQVANGMIALSREGLVVAILADPFPDEDGLPGLFTETRCRFESMTLDVAEEER